MFAGQVQMHCRNSQSNVRHKSFSVMTSIFVDILVAESRELIGLAIPQVIALLSDSERNVRQASADALWKLSEQCKALYFLT
jgi:hypothetical protein